MTQPNRTDPEFIRAVEDLAEQWVSGLDRNVLLSHERKETYRYVVWEFVKWMKEGPRSRLPRR